MEFRFMLILKKSSEFTYHRLSEARRKESRCWISAFAFFFSFSFIWARWLNKSVCFFSFLLIDFIHPKATIFFPITTPILGWCITGHSGILGAVDHLRNAFLFLEWVRPFQKRKSEQQDSMRVPIYTQ